MQLDRKKKIEHVVKITSQLIKGGSFKVHKNDLFIFQVIYIYY